MLAPKLFLGLLDDKVDSLSDELHPAFSVEIHSDLIICCHEVIEFKLQLLVLAVDVRDVLVQSIDLGMQVNFVALHLVLMLLQPGFFFLDVGFLFEKLGKLFLIIPLSLLVLFLPLLSLFFQLLNKVVLDF